MFEDHDESNEQTFADSVNSVCDSITSISKEKDFLLVSIQSES